MMPSPVKKIPIFLSAAFLMLILLINPQKAEAQRDFDVMSCVRSAESTEAMVECGDEYISFWNDRMQLSLDQLEGLLPEARQIMLEESQDAWNEYRVTQVNLSNTIHFGSGDDMHRVMARIREARLYQQRSEYLEDLIVVQQATRSRERSN
ncbi:MAG: lysozyme inhibitor LprI family protein [Balneolia bacterium]|nr:lysozyme inhibitor LprI family protein [Balneolia bacterium]